MLLSGKDRQGVAALLKNRLTYNFMVRTIEGRKDLENLPAAQIFYLCG